MSDAAEPSVQTELGRPRVLGDTVITLRMGIVLTWLLTLIAASVVLTGAWQIVDRFSHILLLLIFAMLVAFLFAPLVRRLEMQRLPRTAAIGLAYTVALLSTALVLAFFFGPLVGQLTGLVRRLPAQMLTAQHNVPLLDNLFSRLNLPFRVADIEKQIVGAVQSVGSVLLSSTLSLFGGITTVLIDMVLVFVISFYLQLEASNIRRILWRVAPPRIQPIGRLAESVILRVVGGYIRGQIIMALIIGVAAGIGCALLGVPDPLVIGLLAGLFELAPMVGPVLGALPAVSISLIFQGFPAVLWVVVLFVVIQQIESNVIGPRITGQAVGLHPLVALLALLIGVELGGILGAFFAVPLAGVAWEFSSAFYRGQSTRTFAPSVPSPDAAPHPRPSPPSMGERLGSIVSTVVSAVDTFNHATHEQRPQRTTTGLNSRRRVRRRQSTIDSAATSDPADVGDTGQPLPPLTRRSASLAHPPTAPED